MEIRKVALTVSPRLQLGNPINILREHCRIYFKDMLNIGEFMLYPEFTDNGRLHYHGMVWIKDQIKWYKKTLPTLNQLGYVMVKNHIDDGWEDYILKNWQVSKQVLGLEESINNEYVKNIVSQFKKKQNIIKDYVAKLDGKPNKESVVSLLNKLNSDQESE